MLGASISRNALLLGLFAAISTAIIAGTFIGTEPTIRDNIRQAEARALLEIFPAESHDNVMLDDAYPIDDSELLGLRTTKKYYLAFQGHKLTGVILPATARDGYTGDIDLIVGIHSNGEIAGVRVLAHRETPGLGDAVERRKSDWVDDFIGKSLLNPSPERWTVKKDQGVFDQFTGATITPRAVTLAVKRALQYFERHHEEFIDKQPIAEADHG